MKNYIAEQQQRIRQNIIDSFNIDHQLSVNEILEKGKKANIGEVREWSGKKYQKQASGWAPVKEGSEGENYEEKWNFHADQANKFASDPNAKMEYAFHRKKSEEYRKKHLESKQEVEKKETNHGEKLKALGKEISQKEKENAAILILKENGFMPSKREFLKSDKLKQAWDLIENYTKQQARKSDQKIKNPIQD